MKEQQPPTGKSSRPLNLRVTDNKIFSLDGLPEGSAPTLGQSATVSRPHSTPRSTSSQTNLVAPIRSLRIRQHPPHPSIDNLQRPDVQTRPPSLRPAPSATITKAIQRLEHLLDQAAQIAQIVTKNHVDSEAQNWSQTYRTVRPSAGIRSRAASIISGPQSSPPSQQTPKPRRLIVSTGLEEPIVYGVAPKYTHSADGLRACDPAHDVGSGNKSSPSTAVASLVGEEMEWKTISPTTMMKTRFIENLHPVEPQPVATQLKEPSDVLLRRRSTSNNLRSKEDVKQHSKTHEQPSVSRRTISVRDFVNEQRQTFSGLPPPLKVNQAIPQIHVTDEDNDKDIEISGIERSRSPGHERHFSEMFGIPSRQSSIDFAHPIRPPTQKIDLKGHRHVDVESGDFNVHESCNHAPVARNWPSSRKRFAATIACMNTACLGIIIGIYAGEVPAIQYVIADFHHYAILGNVVFYCGLAIPTFLLWPLPLLHGRKPYTVVSLLLALCLQIPQGIAVGAFRSPYIETYRAVLLLSRAVCGFVFGFAAINFQAALMDLFGASLQSNNPHQEIADPCDVRRHGGGMGLWIGIWSWCSIGSISIGFLVGTFIISGINVSWGFWISLFLLMIILLLNVIAPEIRRSAFRRTIAEIQGQSAGFRRVARGEVKMHLKGTGPYWWGEEVKAGMEMCWLMVKQPGFFILALYAAWVYAQFTIVLMFLGALTSTYYTFRPVYVGLCVSSLGLGALLATPFQKASWLSRARYRPPRTDSMTFQKGVSYSSHLSRRTCFTVMLPLSAIGYTLTMRGPPFPVITPCVFAAVVGFLTNLAIAECYGLVMETFDTSDLQPGMTGRPARKSVVEKLRGQRTNFSCHPRVSAGLAVIESLKFVFGAAATGLAGRLERCVGAMRATGIVAGVLFLLTVLLTLVLVRWKTITLNSEIKHQLPRQGTSWEPVILGRASGTTRKISILEWGQQTRWSEIRRRNRVNSGLTGG